VPFNSLALHFFNRIDTTLNTWLEGLWGNLLEAFPVAEGLSVIPDDVLPPPWLKITPIHTNGVTPGKGKEREKPEGTLWTTLSKNERATASDHFQDVRYLEFSFEHDLEYVCILFFHRWAKSDVNVQLSAWGCS